MNNFLDRTEIIGVLSGFNPWWSTKPHAIPSFRRLVFEACKRYLEDTTFQIVFEAIKQLIETDANLKKKIAFTVKEKQATYGGKSNKS